MKKHNNGIPFYAWCITWAIMVLTVIFNLMQLLK